MPSVPPHRPRSARHYAAVAAVLIALMVGGDLVADRPLHAAELAMFVIVAIVLEAVLYLLDRWTATRSGAALRRRVDRSRRR